MSIDHSQKDAQIWFAQPDNHAVIDIQTQKMVYPNPVALVWTQWDHVCMPDGWFVSLQITVYLAELRRDSYGSCSVFDRQASRWVEINRIGANGLKAVEVSQGKKFTGRFDDGQIDDEDLQAAFQSDITRLRSIALQILTSQDSAAGRESELLVRLFDIQRQVKWLIEQMKGPEQEEEAPVHEDHLYQLALYACESVKVKLYPKVSSLSQAQELAHPDDLRLVIEDTRDDLRFPASFRQEWQDLGRRLHEVWGWWDAGVTEFRVRLAKGRASTHDLSSISLTDGETSEMIGTSLAFAYSAEFEQQLWYLGGWLFQWRETFPVTDDEAE